MEAPSWLAQQLRLTAFTYDTSVGDHTAWWHVVTGESPAETATKLKEHQFFAAGETGKGKLLLNRSLPRVDWLYGPTEREHDPPLILPSTGPFREELRFFSDLMHKWLDVSPPVYRLALGGLLYLPAESREDGYTHLKRYLPALTIDPIGSSDLLYQINRPRRSGSKEGLEINRLSKWSVISLIRARLTVGPELLASSDVTRLEFGGRLELDVNSSIAEKGDIREMNALATHELHSLLDELAVFSQEIAREGDVP